MNKRLIILPLIFAAGTASASTPQQDFFDSLKALCGKAFEGKVARSDSSDNAFAKSRLVMHVRECGDSVIKVPFHVGEDHSRTWVITRTDAGLRLKHDHRHQDGSEDKVTQYGGDTADIGSARWQSFPVDAESIANFKANGLDKSVTNVWHLGLNPQVFSYRLTRENRDFLVEFDLTKPVELPPAPWGHE
ncbi:hypothetical protein [Shewanella jiangmenensis]|uniref:hypothetical protein n=1 Tax=Shewanella jiangmenensis TaxID=2837387 RepID=UPI0020331846|nr:hypothetical protein [Shewanella jiangmenensis]